MKASFFVFTRTAFCIFRIVGFVCNHHLLVLSTRNKQAFGFPISALHDSAAREQPFRLNKYRVWLGSYLILYPCFFSASTRSCTRTWVAARSRECSLAADADSPLDQTFGILFSKELNPCPMQVLMPSLISLLCGVLSPFHLFLWELLDDLHE
jgi:hypothetical protein